MRPEPLLRASDAERENTVAILQRHTFEGRLSMDEFDERSRRAYEARTRGDLAAMLDDLPAAGEAPRSRVARRRWPVVTATVLAGLAALGLLSGVATAAGGMMMGGGMCH